MTSQCALALGGLLSSVGLTPAPHASVIEFLAAKKPDVPGCLVLDVRMPGISGLDFQEKLCGLGIHLPVILMTGHGDVRMSVRGMKAGAVDFLTKPFRDQDMLDAVCTAIRRDRVRRDGDAVVTGLRERFTTLSPREREVMLLVTSGKRNKQVADNLGVTENHRQISSWRGDAQNGRAYAGRPGADGRGASGRQPRR
jgi:FixJ family two-component response regulator